MIFHQYLLIFVLMSQRPTPAEPDHLYMVASFSVEAQCRNEADDFNRAQAMIGNPDAPQAFCFDEQTKSGVR